MERALNRDDLADALGELPNIPTAEELQRLLADSELSLFTESTEVPDELVQTGWYLHAVASQAQDQLPWSRRERAFRVSAHILELALNTDRPDHERLDFAFGAELGYRRGALDPNATAVFAQVLPLLASLDDDRRLWRETLAVEAAIYLLSFRPRETFAWLRARRDDFIELRTQTQLEALAGTMFGPAEHVVEGCWGLLRFLLFGDREALAGGQARLQLLVGEAAEPATTNEKWVAAHLISLSNELDAGSIWSALPPDVPEAARRALTLTSPPVLTLWPPQRELLTGHGREGALLSSATTRAVLSIPTSAGKTLIAQIMVLSELASTHKSVCLVAPQRSLVREIRRALLPRVRALRKRLSPDVPDFLADFAAELIDEDPPDVDVMTPERFAALLRADPQHVLDRYGLFIFDEAHLVGDKDRGFKLEGALTYLHWRTRRTDHRIILMSAGIGNQATFQAWLGGDLPLTPFQSEWRGPRRLSAVYTTSIRWEQERQIPAVGRERLDRVEYPVLGRVSFTIPGAGTRAYSSIRPIGVAVYKQKSDGARGLRDDERSTRHYEHVASLATFLEHAGPVLTVTGTRPDAQRLATALATERTELAALRRARDAAAAMLDAEHPLVPLLARGVAYHHAGLPLDVQTLIEDELRAGRLRHLVSTTTLTEGVNLPVHTVILAEIRWDGSDVHISGPRMLNAIGRAGRAGIETEGWVIFAPNGEAPHNPERHLPDPEQLEIRSRLATKDTLEALDAFEQRRRSAADAVFSELPTALAEFTTFVWYVLACEEALAGAVLDAELDEIVDTLFAARQLAPSELSRLRRFARDVRSTYAASDPARRRGWARGGSHIQSAIILDTLGRRLAEHALGREDRASVGPAIDLLRDSGALAEALALPDVDDNVWRFRRTTRGEDVEVDLTETLQRWTSGEPLSSMADALLAGVPDRAWRLEQFVDRVSRGFGHYISWMIAVLIERANEVLSATDDSLICANLPLYVRFGVDSPVALRLIMSSVRNRDVVVRVARAARELGVEDGHFEQWLRSVPMERWGDMFGAGASDALDLLEAISDTHTHLLRRLLDGESVDMEMEHELSPGQAGLEILDLPYVSIVALRSAAGARFPLPAQWQSDLRTVLATGVQIDATVSDDGSVVLRAMNS